MIDADRLELAIIMMPDEELCEDCCYNVVNAIDNAPTVGGWISVKDRMPPNDSTKVLTYGDPVTHWMLLPKPPKEEK